MTISSSLNAGVAGLSANASRLSTISDNIANSNTFGSIPLLPYFLLDPDQTTFHLSVLATFAALVMLGLLRWQVTVESIWRCVAETVGVGGVCAVIAYAVGLIIGG